MAIKHQSLDNIVSVLIGRIYDAAIDESLWTDTADAIAKAFDSCSANIQIRDIHNNSTVLLSLTDNFDKKALISYEQYYYKKDIWYERFAKCGLLQIISTRDVVADEELERSEIFQDFGRQLGIFYGIGSLIPVASGVVGVLGLHRPKSGVMYSEDEKNILNQFQHHLQRALQIRRRLLEPDIGKDAALDALERSATATLVVGRSGQILYANSRAEGLLRERDGVVALGGNLTAQNQSDSERLTALIRAAVDTAAGSGSQPGGSLQIARAQRLPLSALIAPFRPTTVRFGPTVPAAIVFIKDPECISKPGVAFQELFGLTPTEAAIAVALSNGKSIQYIAKEANVRADTVRKHVVNIMAKTSTCRQTQLISCLLKSVATLN